MIVLRFPPYLRPRGVGWLLLAAFAVLMVIVPARLHQRAEYMQQVVAAQEKLNQDLWRSLPSEPVAGLSDALGEEGARRFMSNFSQVERQSLKAPECKWATGSDIYQARWGRGPLSRMKEVSAGDIICSSFYDTACRVEDRLELSSGRFTTVWRRENGVWKLAGAHSRSGGCIDLILPYLLDNPSYLRARARLKND